VTGVDGPDPSDVGFPPATRHSGHDDQGVSESFTVVPIPPDVLVRVRRVPSGGSADRLVAAGGEPLRCCLRDASPDEGLLLFGYRPPLPAPSPYQEEGAVFVHAEPCAGPADDGYPSDWSSRPQVLRAYSADGRIHPASRVHDGSDPVRILDEVLATEGVVEVHSRNVVYGCYMFTARLAARQPELRQMTGSGR
jgi:hypothetical protein